MYQETQLPLRVIVIMSNASGRAALVAEGRSDPRFKIIGDFPAMTAAYAQTEAHAPDLTLCSQDFCKQPEFPMFSAMVKMAGSTLVVFEDGASFRSITRSFRRPTAPAAPAPRVPTVAPGTPQRLVAIGASTGGIEALSTVLSAYPVNCPPTVVVQHIKPDYLAGVVERLDRACPATVIAAEDGLKLRAGQVVFAPGLPSHLEVEPRSMKCRIRQGPPVSGHCPSVDVLFNSVAAYKNNAVGVILTGMGRDGAAGLGQMRQAGARTIAQDAETSTVYGMPRVAFEQGAACDVLPLKKISKAILAAAVNRSEVTQ